MRRTGWCGSGLASTIRTSASSVEEGLPGAIGASELHRAWSRRAAERSAPVPRRSNDRLVRDPAQLRASRLQLSAHSRWDTATRSVTLQHASKVVLCETWTRGSKLLTRFLGRLHPAWLTPSSRKPTKLGLHSFEARSTDPQANSFFALGIVSVPVASAFPMGRFPLRVALPVVADACRTEFAVIVSPARMRALPALPCERRLAPISGVGLPTLWQRRQFP